MRWKKYVWIFLLTLVTWAGLSLNQTTAEAQSFSSQGLFGGTTRSFQANGTDANSIGATEQSRSAFSSRFFCPPSGYGYIEILKYDRDNCYARLAGAQFTIYDSCGRIVRVVETGKDGMAYANRLPLGRYVVRETKAPAGYVLDASPIQVCLTRSGQLVSLRKYNVKVCQPLGSLSIKKRNEQNQILPGAQFKIYDRNQQVVSYTETNSKGEANIYGLLPGTYQVVEVKAPAGYQLDQTPRQVTVAGNHVDLTVVNKRESGRITVQKTDNNGSPLAGAVFEVKNSAGHVVGTLTSDAKGHAELKDLPFDMYRVAETKAPEGYQIVRTPYYLPVSSQAPHATVGVVNMKARGVMNLVKKDAQTGQLLADAEFAIYDQADQLVKTVTTGKDGRVRVAGLSLDEVYTVVETRAPAGYQVDPTPRHWLMNYATPEITVEVVNRKVSGTIEIVAVNQNDVRLPGAVFEIYNSAGKFIGERVTTAQGHIILTQMPYDTYKIVETKAPNGYQLDSTPKYLEVNAAHATLTVKHEPVPCFGDLEITKFEKDSNPVVYVEGSVLEVYNAGNRLIGTFTTDTAGIVRVPKLQPGVYTVVEKQAADGYEWDQTRHQVTVTRGQTAKLSLASEKSPCPVTGSLKIHLKELDFTGIPTGRNVAGAVFEVTDAKGNIFTAETDANGEILLDNLAFGSASIRQTKFPEHYMVIDVGNESVRIVPGETVETVFFNALAFSEI